MNATSIDYERNINSANSKPASIYEFDRFRLDAVHLMLYENRRPVSLAPKVIETLLALIEKRGEVVGKDELMDRLWANTFVEESNLTQNIYRLRKTLGKAQDGQYLIESFKRRGYRFNGQIREEGEVELVVGTRTKTLTVIQEEIDENDNLTYRLTPKKPDRWKKLAVVAAAAIFGGLLIFGASRFFQSKSKPNDSNSVTAAPVIKMTRLTPDQNATNAAISPDGKYLAYNLFEKGKHSLWVKDIASDGATQIMPAVEQGAYGDLMFSPDGKQIYYNSRLGPTVNYTLYRIPAFGGEPQKIAQNVISPPAVSPNGKQVAFVSFEGEEGKLIIVDTDTGEERVLVSRSKPAWYESWGSNLSWSPDGLRIVVCGGKGIHERKRFELIEVSVADGSERIIPIPEWNYLDDVVWLSDQSGLLVRIRETEVSPWQIWRVSYPNGEASRLTNDTNNYDDLSLSANSRFLVTKQQLGNNNLWIAPSDDITRIKQITFGNNASDGYHGIAFVPDDRAIYTSPRGGNVDLWIVSSDGNEQKQLTRNAGDFNGRPRVTLDGGSIVFVSSRSGTKQIWRMDENGGNPRQLTDVKSAEQPYLSPDGAWIYFTLGFEERRIIAKIPVDGGEIVSVHEKNDPSAPIISPDGKKMLFDFYEDGAAQPWKRGLLFLENGDMGTLEENGLVQSWTADSKSLISIRDKTNLWIVPLDGGKARRLTNFESGEIRTYALSPDFKQIVIARGSPSMEALLITDF